MRVSTLVPFLVLVTLASLAATAAAAPAEADASATGPDGAPLAPGNAGRAVIHAGLAVDADGDDEAESKVLLADVDLGKVEPGAATNSRLDLVFYRDDGTPTDPMPEDPDSITSIRQVYLAVVLDTDSEPGDDQLACASTPNVW